MTKSNIMLLKNLEKKFSVFRWILLIIVVPITITLSNFEVYSKLMIAPLFLGCVMNIFITIIAYSKSDRFVYLLKFSMYFDIFLTSLILCVRGGLRSDIYYIYYLLILYNGAKFGFSGTINSLLQSIFYFSIATFFFTSQNDFDLNHYIIKVIYLIALTFVMYEINHLINESRVKEEVARDLAHKDPLTKLHNRLSMSEHFEKMRLSSENFFESFAIVLVDIDNFKKINDTKGHAFGDQVLLSIANIIKENTSSEDFVCRFGGEEFLAFFADCDANEAIIKANKLCSNIAFHNFEGRTITVSIGINIFKKDYTMIENITFADEAMYAVKNSGKNNVKLYKDWIENGIKIS